MKYTREFWLAVSHGVGGVINIHGALLSKGLTGASKWIGVVLKEGRLLHLDSVNTDGWPDGTKGSAGCVKPNFRSVI